MTSELIKFILILLLSTPLIYILYHSDLLRKKRHTLALVGFVTLHFVGLFLYNLVNVFFLVILSLIGIFLTYMSYWINKKQKKTIDYLKLMWAGLFILTYYISWNNYNIYCSWCIGQYFAGIFPPFSPDYVYFLHLTHYIILLTIAFIVHSENRIFKHSETKTKIP